MNLEEFIDDFASQFDDTPIESFEAETIYKDLDEWSSLMALSLIAMADENYNVALRGDDIKNTDTIKDLYLLIESKQ